MNAVAANPAGECPQAGPAGRPPRGYEQSGRATFGEAVEALYRDESRRIFATLVRLLGDLDSEVVKESGVSERTVQAAPI